MTMNVSLTPELEAFINQKVKSGLYGSASEVVRESLRLLKRHDELESLQLGELKREINEGLAQLNAGKGITVKAVRARVATKRAGKR